MRPDVVEAGEGCREEKLPPGFRFHPTDEELVSYYLARKLSESTFITKAIADVDLNKCEPWDLPGRAKMGEKEWYFFSLRDRKYPTGVRTNRATNSGYWKTTGKDKEILIHDDGRSSEVAGMKKTLVFYKGRAPRGEKTNWVMHEYRAHSKSDTKRIKDEWVVCRVFIKSSINGGKKYSGGSQAARLNQHGFDTAGGLNIPCHQSFLPYHYQPSIGQAAAVAAEMTELALYARSFIGVGFPAVHPQLGFSPQLPIGFNLNLVGRHPQQPATQQQMVTATEVPPATAGCNVGETGGFPGGRFVNPEVSMDMDAYWTAY
ncbi:hypothetical protein HPP92_016516 [Vanilla planifolia]|uniref:NAC domain-containing protein n=1 Tax=Vanilla planifolia TaxID=51239 RepID=A0A835UTF2_VANPL|nr:hypothetical protein HPP92_016516 [Vanilla planifolia]